MPAEKGDNSPPVKLKATAPAWTPGAPNAKATTAPPPAASAWGKKSDAVKAAAPIVDNTPPPRQVPQRNTSYNNRRQSSGGNKHDNKGRKGSKGGKNNRNSRSDNGGDWQQKDTSSATDYPTAELWKTGEGRTDEAKKIRRIPGPELLALRLAFLDAPTEWDQKEESEENLADVPVWRWVSDSRTKEIEEKTKGPRIGGDIKPTQRRKSSVKETAPPLEECVPLEKNDETRWKAKVFKGEFKEEETDEVIMKKALVCLNKLTLTKFDIVSDKFIETGIGRNQECLTEAISLIVSKAQGEPHFAAMYASLCLKLAITPMEATGEEAANKRGKKFKKLLLERCQVEFEKDTNEVIAEAVKDVEDEAEKEYKAGIIKKNYLGHMQFIGELYKGDLLSIKIMLVCLPELLQGSGDEKNSVDEEKVECFTKLMTTIGERLEHQSEYLKSAGKDDSSKALAECWQKVEGIARNKEGFPQVSTRLRFLLQDLIEMRNKGWEQRRKVETAKTIAQIHKEVAREEAKMGRSRSNGNLRKSGSSNSIRRRSSAPAVDEDGFTSIPRKSNSFSRSVSEGSYSKNSKSSKEGGMRRTGSRGSFVALDNITETKTKPPSPPPKQVVVADKVPTEKDIEKSTQNILKEFFIGGDTDDAVLSLTELIGEGDGAVERATAVLSGGCLLVMEMKQEEVDKFISILLRCIKEAIFVKGTVIAGLQRPLDVVSDIAIDAPLAIAHMVQIVATCIKEVSIDFDFILKSPEWFLTEGNAAKFGTKVLKRLGDDALTSEDNIKVIEQLMTERDRGDFANVTELMAAC
mmetsp:Transcript_20394/g.31194  ORF Transcript_20394/g.31194 Transcript_20394/m.31194 type:complete len:805 (+) Transcript_20394:1042-3456(+)|eukprot:CAMPEP_0196808872 /NCGR_PEP_ID=MMETSP1362-20130617/8863_1 /TAXON_ID=163516 /ORGANISM="Leptocylindrus danicus, Strain CCMP1856" /LENGTH=804 /DNA_ID=CAMNT_0042183375 /DNA_START=904 /DNA_END=3318 /DNA_ORIENTATION=+